MSRRQKDETLLQTNGLRSEENLRLVRKVLYASIALFMVFSGFSVVEMLFFGNDIAVSRGVIIGGAALMAVILLVYLAFPHPVFFPLFIATLTAVVFIGTSMYTQAIDYYFFVMLLVVCILSLMNNFMLLVIYIGINLAIDLFAFIVLVPRLEWIDSFHFFRQFMLFIYGSAFVLIHTRNITRKESSSDRALAAFSSLLRSTPNLMAITDASSRVLYLSDQMAKFIKCSNKEFAIGQPLIDLIADKGLKIMFADMLDADGFFETVTELNIGGEERYFKIIADKLTGDIEGVFIDIADITPTVKSNLAMMEAQVAAEEANRSKSNFLATMSHEIRTPMNAIIGITQIQMQKEDLPAEYALAMEKIYSSGNNLLGLINDILDMSRIETGKLELQPTEYDLPSLINDTVHLNIVRIGSKQIQFMLEVDETLPVRLIGDEMRLKQILNNLLSNGIKYTDQGHVKLSVSHSAEGDEAALRLVIEDTGQGMTPEDMEKLFTEYSRFNARLNRATEGAGLGLNITKKLVELMDGTIQVESEYDKGTVFTVEVKQKAVACDAIGAELVEKLRSFTYTGEKQISKLQITRTPMPYGKVLIVDDVETNLYVAEGLMAPYKLKIETASGGLEAIRLIESGNLYDVIFMDHMMPQMDGIEAVQKIRALGYTGAIVALTANALAGNDVMFAQNGFDSFIPKPIDVRHLNALLNQFVRDKYPEEAKKYKPETETPVKPVDINPKLIQIFCCDAEKAVAALRQTVADGDLKLFTITVHAMKSALANIEEHDISAQAHELEKAGRSGNWRFIIANTERFIDTLEALTKKLSPADATAGANENIKEDTAYLAEQLQIVRDACEEYDDTAAYAALERLMEKPWKKETAAALEQIRNTLFLHSDFDGAAEKAGSLIE
ncbi:MAG: response regulator [Oscillospiraceae bacterium]|jgi:signal transduction histidine kinase/CheY-like chemotaxis protein/HPt (histidine-containing phosphotransfer) domain-containing protein|nr:response regulator [Oscillospiraceae bacterium]